jgi:hypothetical protein
MSTTKKKVSNYLNSSYLCLCRNIQPRDVTRTTTEQGWQIAWKPPQEQPSLETFTSKFILSFSRLAHRQSVDSVKKEVSDTVVLFCEQFVPLKRSY